jgi:hypothetical protein
MDNMLEFSVSNWGITFSTAPFYFNMSWGLILLVAGLLVARKIIKVKRS